jgi:catechol 2,3-dioxygenase-like lactoylglutathione lyase family enzyme
VIDHVGVRARDVARSRAFYLAVLAPLGGHVFREDADGIGFFGSSHGSFWVRPAEGEGPITETHLAFRAASRAEVDAFYTAAVELGAEVTHAPRVWPEYHPAYYGAFVRDPDGHNVEAVCHVGG